MQRKTGSGQPPHHRALMKLRADDAQRDVTLRPPGDKHKRTHTNEQRQSNLPVHKNRK